MNKAITAISTAVVLVLGLGPASQAETSPAWDRAAAARYMDARMDLWWEKAKSLKTGNGEAKCLSCHTGVPYALARAGLRHAEGQGALTPNERRMLDIVTSRVASRDGDQPYYDHNPAKIVESRGTEPVINALVLTQYDSDVAPRAIERLWDTQRADGAWDWLDFAYEPAESADSVFQGAAIAAFAVGSQPGMKASGTVKGKAGRERLRGYVQANVASQNLYNRTWALLASSRLQGLLTAEQRDMIIRDLVAAQRQDGGWSFSEFGPWRWSRTAVPFEPHGTLDKDLLAQSDGLATGMAVYALKAVGREEVLVKKGRDWLIMHQIPERAGDEAWAPWRAHSLNYDREHGGPKGESWRRMFMSDLATGFSVLALQ
jgi:hypothetical protein